MMTLYADFESYGVGGELLNSIGAPQIEGELLPGYSVLFFILVFVNVPFLIRYTAWLPDRTVSLYRNIQQWHEERLAKLGNSSTHRQFWEFFDHLSSVFWDATRKGIMVVFYNTFLF